MDPNLVCFAFKAYLRLYCAEHEPLSTNTFIPYTDMLTHTIWWVYTLLCETWGPHRETPRASLLTSSRRGTPQKYCKGEPFRNPESNTLVLQQGPECRGPRGGGCNFFCRHETKTAHPVRVRERRGSGSLPCLGRFPCLCPKQQGRGWLVPQGP